MKILFFITQRAGRIVMQDVATMKLILEAVPEIGRNYGIIVNKIPVNVLDELLNIENQQSFALSLYTGIKDEFQHNNILLLPLNQKMDNNDNALLHPSEIHESLDEFVKFSVPEANITEGKVTKIQVDDLERLTTQIEEMEAEWKANQEQQLAAKENLLLQLQDSEKDRNQQQEEDQKRNEEDIKKLEKDIEMAEKQMEDVKKETEIEHLNQQIQQMKLMHAQQQHVLTQQQQFIIEQQNRVERRSRGNQIMGVVCLFFNRLRHNYAHSNI